MKKSLFIISFILVIVLALTACSKQNSTQDTNNSPSESLTMLDEGVWPENEYTEGLSVPPGTVSWAVLDGLFRRPWPAGSLPRSACARHG